MITLATLRGFSDELLKLAVEVPLVSRLSSDQEKSLLKIDSKIGSSSSTILGHSNVAVPVRKLGDLEELGFKKTRLAVPLPGERIGTPSWRRGALHAHLAGDHYLFHKDMTSPQGLLQVAKHVVREGLPAAAKRFSERKDLPIVVRETPWMVLQDINNLGEQIGV